MQNKADGNSTRRFVDRQRKKWFLPLAVVFVLTLGPVQALYKTSMPGELQTKKTEPQPRRLHLKLPLTQPLFHWTFLSRQELLAGKLVLRISRADEVVAITIFEGGKFSEGWAAIELPNPKAGEIYFGFQSTNKYPTAPGDGLELELQVTKELEGIGPIQTGVLPAGTYKTRGTYSGLIDNYNPAHLGKNVPEETMEQIRAIYAFKAFLESWEIEWPLRITSDDGWLSPSERRTFQKARRAMEGKPPLSWDL